MRLLLGVRVAGGPSVLSEAGRAVEDWAGCRGLSGRPDAVAVRNWGPPQLGAGRPVRGSSGREGRPDVWTVQAPEPSGA
ncbi:hypothetical protein GCM10029964_077090 [Kibdelosporangium lantanae]